MIAATEATADSSLAQRLMHPEPSPCAVNPEYQELKFTLHRKLL